MGRLYNETVVSFLFKESKWLQNLLSPSETPLLTGEFLWLFGICRGCLPADSQRTVFVLEGEKLK